jgi:Fic family protein
MARPTSIAPARDIAQIAKRISDAELRVSTLRSQLDARLFTEHERGVAIAQLARAADMSRETVYKAIRRYRSQPGA